MRRWFPLISLVTNVCLIVAFFAITSQNTVLRNQITQTLDDWRRTIDEWRSTVDGLDTANATNRALSRTVDLQSAQLAGKRDLATCASSPPGAVAR